MTTAALPDPLACSCGRRTPHVVAARRTSDGHAVKAWSDGSLTDRWGFYIVRARRASWSRLRAGVARDLVMGDVELYDHDEVRALWEAAYAASVYVVGYDFGVDYARRVMRETFAYHAGRLRRAKPTA